ncbi:unnamed protein product [Rotaria socialis]|uniref:Uncharacterized protein n=1 Tax=Rotaria socialis TaxID=392032 RepID=A0A821VBC8_9BILA|nr:unnamed protein product [Rotaria socialis]CAF4904719.1 unnamed protein product [Rotaria socialis]
MVKQSPIDLLLHLIQVLPNLISLEHVCDMTIELFSSSFLNYINTNHCGILVLCLSAADGDTVKCFKEIIEQKHLAIDFTIKRILNRIYLQWN